MFAIFRVLFVVLGSLASLTALAQAENNNSNPDQSAALAALASARSGDWPQAYTKAGQLKDPLPLKMVRWLDYMRSNAGYRFPDIAAFIAHMKTKQLKGWTRQRKLALIESNQADCFV